MMGRGSGWVQRVGAGGIEGGVQAVGKGAIPNLLIRLLTIWHRKKLTARGSVVDNCTKLDHQNTLYI